MTRARSRRFSASRRMAACRSTSGSFSRSRSMLTTQSLCSTRIGAARVSRRRDPNETLVAIHVKVTRRSPGFHAGGLSGTRPTSSLPSRKSASSLVVHSTTPVFFRSQGAANRTFSRRGRARRAPCRPRRGPWRAVGLCRRTRTARHRECRASCARARSRRACRSSFSCRRPRRTQRRARVARVRSPEPRDDRAERIEIEPFDAETARRRHDELRERFETRFLFHDTHRDHCAGRRLSRPHAQPTMNAHR